MTLENFWEIDMLPSTFIPLLFSHVAVGLLRFPPNSVCGATFCVITEDSIKYMVLSPRFLLVDIRVVSSFCC